MDITEEPEREALTGRTLRGTLVQVVSSLGLSGLSLVQGVLFARWFLPSQLGMYESATLVVRVAGLFSQLGTRQALIREGERFRRALASALVFDGLVSSLSYVALLVGAPWIARQLGNEQLTFWIRLLAITSYSTTLALPAAQWDRAMRFGIAKLPRALGTLVTIGATAGLLARGVGTESLLWGALAGFAAEHAILWLLVPYRPRPGWHADEVRRLAAFTLPLILNALLNYVVFEGDDVMVRFFRDDAALAIYRKAFEWPFFLTNLVAMTSAVLYPAMCRVAAEPKRLDRAFAVSNRYIGLITLPAGVGLAIFSLPLVRLLFGSAWLASVPLMRIFAVAFALRTATGYNWHLLPMSRGDTRSVARVGAGSALLTVCLGLPLISRYGGLGGALTNVLVLALWALPARFWVIRRELGNLAFLRDVTLPLVAVCGASLVALLPVAESWLALAVQVAAFTVSYLVILLVLRPRLIAEAYALVRAMRQR